MRKNCATSLPVTVGPDCSGVTVVCQPPIAAVCAGLAVGEDRAGHRRQLGHVDAVELAAVDPDHPLAQHVLVPGPPGEDVGGGDEVDGAPHEVNPHHLPPFEQLRERRRVEPAQPGPEPDERLLRLLRLQAAQVRDGVEDRQVGPVEQQLPGERGAVERAGVQHGHRITPPRVPCGRGAGLSPSGAGS